jgi:hypothetical protein
MVMPGCRAPQRFSRIVYRFVGVVLLVAAVLKLHVLLLDVLALGMDSLASPSVLSHWVLVSAEAGIGMAFLFHPPVRVLSLMGMAIFAVFAMINIQ